MDLLASVIAERCRNEEERQWGKEKNATKNIFSAKRLNDACVRDKNLGRKNCDIIRKMLVYVKEKRRKIIFKRILY